MESWLPTSPPTQLTVGEHCPVQEAVSAFKILLKRVGLQARWPVLRWGSMGCQESPGWRHWRGCTPKGSHHFVTRVELQACQRVCLEEGVWL